MITFKERVGWGTYFTLPTPTTETPIIVLPTTPFEIDIRVDSNVEKPSTVILNLKFISEKDETQVSIEKRVEKPEPINVKVKTDKDGFIVEHDQHINIVSGKWDKLKASAHASEGDAVISKCIISCYDPAMALVDTMYNMQQAMIMFMYMTTLLSLMRII